MSQYKIQYRNTDNTDLCEADDEFGYISPCEVSIIDAASISEANKIFNDNMYGFRTEIESITIVQ